MGHYVGGAINTLFRFPLGLPSALTYGAAEFAHQVTGDPRAARDALMMMQVAPMAKPGFAGPKEFAVAPRVSPMMDAFERMEAQRATEPSRPQPTSEVENNIARVQAQLGVGPDRPPPPPSPSATPADRVPPGVPPGTEVPISLRIQAALEAANDRPAGPRADFVPPDATAPPDRVPPGAAGPATGTLCVAAPAFARPRRGNGRS